jgi:hypothetical protein
VVLAAGTVGTGFSREEICAVADEMAWASHKPYWRSVLKYGQTYGVGKLLGKIVNTLGARLRRKPRLPF